MATRKDAVGLEAAGSTGQAMAIGGIRFDWAVVGASAWLVGGLVVDGWAHNHGKIDNTFFTPWHAIFYTGYMVTALVLIGAMILNHSRGYAWGRALPTGYELSVLGVAIFALGGVGDLIWHELFGFEVSTEALLSPTHLLLGLGIALMITGPLRAAWRRTQAGGWRAYLPMLLSATLFLSVMTFISQFAHPFVNPATVMGTRPSSGAELRLQAGVAAVLMQTVILMGFILLLMRRWTLPSGSFTLMFTINIALMTTQHDSYALIPAAFVSGVIADLLAWRLKPSVTRANALRLFVFVVPVVLYGLYFLTIALIAGIWWRIHTWAGAMALAGIVAVLLSYLVTPAHIEPVAES